MDMYGLRRWHSFTGLVPLSAYLAFHTWEHWPVRDGRDAVLQRLALTSNAPIEILFLLLPLLVHAALGLRLARQPDASPAYHSPAFRGLQRATGLVLGTFLVWHIGWVWLPRIVGGGGARAAYAAMRDQAGPVLGMSLYVLGISAVCVHFAQGLAAVWIRSSPEAPVRLVRWMASAFGMIIWVAMIVVLAVYATGAALL